MKKLINDPHAVVEEMISGILKAYPSHLRAAEGSSRALVRKDTPINGKVAIITGGGSGHLPLFLGYVGPGLLHGVAAGNVFSSPSADDMLAAIREVDGGAGVLCLFGNYGGDRMNFELAAGMAREEGRHVELAIAADDVASAPRHDRARRRGIAGIFFAYKIAGAKAESGASMPEVKAVAEAVIDRTCSMGVALSPCTIPAVGEPTFAIGEGEIELGTGIHGEPGVERTRMKPAAEIAELVTNRLLDDLPFVDDDRVAVLVNGLGATPMEELFVLYDRVHDILRAHGIFIDRTYVGEYATSMEMSGASLSLLRLTDELTALLDAPAFSPFLPQWAVR